MVFQSQSPYMLYGLFHTSVVVPALTYMSANLMPGNIGHKIQQVMEEVDGEEPKTESLKLRNSYSHAPHKS